MNPWSFFRSTGVRHAAAAVGMVLLGGLAWHLTSARGAEPPVAVVGAWVPVQASEHAGELVAFGRLAPARVVEVGSAAAGVLVEFDVEWGEVVKAGQILGRIESPELDGQLRQAEAAALRARLEDETLFEDDPADVSAARRRVGIALNAERVSTARLAETEELLDKGFAARQELEAAQVDLEERRNETLLAQAELKSLLRKYGADQRRAQELEIASRRADYQALLERRARLTLRAPFDGVAVPPSNPEGAESGARERRPGSTVATGDAIVAIADMSEPHVVIQVPEIDLAWVKPGLEATVTLGTMPDTVLKAEVKQVSGRATTSRFDDGQKAEFEATVQLRRDGAANSDARHYIRWGGSATVRLPRQVQATVVRLPLRALVWGSAAAAHVRWRASDGASDQLRPVRIVSTETEDAIVKGLEEGWVWLPGLRAGAGAPVP